MLLFKSSLVTKFAFGALGLLLGIGGISVGAHLSSRQTARKVFAARILTVQAGPNHRYALVHVITRSGLTITVTVTPQTVITYKGRTLTLASLRPGDTAIGQVHRQADLGLVATRIQLIKLAQPLAAGP